MVDEGNLKVRHVQLLTFRDKLETNSRQSDIYDSSMAILQDSDGIELLLLPTGDKGCFYMFAGHPS